MVCREDRDLTLGVQVLGVEAGLVSSKGRCSRATSARPVRGTATCSPGRYTVHPLAIGHRIEVKAGLDEVLVFCEGTEVARHVRCWARHQSITDPAPSAAARHRPPGRLQRPGRRRRAEVEQRSPDTYDRIFGVIEGGQGREEIA
jgi:hypothetical protein